MVTTGEKIGCGFSLLTARQQGVFGASKSDATSDCEQSQMQQFVEAKRSDLRNGLTRRQRVFLLEKLVGLNDKDAALAAGYSLSVAENTKQRIWKPRVRAEWERLQREVASKLLQERRPQSENEGSENLSGRKRTVPVPACPRRFKGASLLPV